MQHYFDAPEFGENWFTFPHLYKYMVETFPDGSRFVEIGSWKGRSAAYMGVEIINSGKKIKLDCIDLWSDELFNGNSIENLNTSDPIYSSYDGVLMNLFLKNIEPVSSVINVVRKDSSEAAKLYQDKSLEFVFIDADHTYEGVKKDIIAWLPKVKSGGILAGHDYGWHEPIRQAVKDTIGEGDFSDPWRNGCFMLQIG